MSKFTESFRTLAALAEIDRGQKVTQRSLAERLDISLGLANGILRQLNDDRLISVGDADTRYSVTRKGRAEMQRLSLACAAEADLILGGFLGELRRSAQRLKASGRKTALICGDGPVAELIASSLKNEGIRIAGVVAAAPSGAPVAAMRVRSVQDASKLKFDVALAVNAADAAILRRALGRNSRIQQIIAG